MNPAELRRALTRRNEATHPVELPPPDHRWAPTPSQTQEELVVVREPTCEICGDGDALDDPVAHFKDPARFGDYVMAHGECGTMNGLELA